MEFKAHTNDAEFQALMRRLKGAGSKANSVMKTSMRRGAKPLLTDLKSEADANKRTGATMRSMGVHVKKSGGLLIGVRYNFRDKKTGKIPNTYAAKIVIGKQGDWFGKVWERHKHALTMKMFGELKTRLTKKGF